MMQRGNMMPQPQASTPNIPLAPGRQQSIMPTSAPASQQQQNGYFGNMMSSPAQMASGLEQINSLGKGIGQATDWLQGLTAPAAGTTFSGAAPATAAANTASFLGGAAPSGAEGFGVLSPSLTSAGMSPWLTGATMSGLEGAAGASGAGAAATAGIAEAAATAGTAEAAGAIPEWMLAALLL